MYWGVSLRFIAIGTLLLGMFGAGWQINGWRLGNQIESLKTEAAEKEAAALAQARKKETILVEQAEQIRKKKDAEIKAINNRLAVALSELRQRPTRDNSAGTTSCTAGTGATLFREDAEFLIGEAARADRLRQALMECYNRYEALRKELNKVE